MGLIPGMPKIPFFLLSVGLGSLGYIVAKSIQEISTELNTENIEEDESSEDRNSREVKDLLRIDPMELELGYSLIPLV